MLKKSMEKEKVFNRQEIIQLIKDELIAVYGNLNKGNIPYTVLGVVHAALDRNTCELCELDLPCDRHKELSL